MTEDEKKIKEFLDEHKQLLDEYKPKGRYETYQYDVLKYLASKLEKYDIPHCEIAEMAVYLAYRANVLVCDEVREYFANQRRKMRRELARGVNNGGE